MPETSLRTHPLIVIAATTVVLTCLIAIAMMLGVIPSPFVRDDPLVSGELSHAAPVARSNLTEPERRTAAGAVERDAVGATSATAPPETVRGAAPGRKSAAACLDCGLVTSVSLVKQQGEAGLVGPAAGTAVGGLIGSQIGSGSGRTVATIVGAAGGAAVGTEIERRYKATTHHIVNVRLNDGTTRRFTFASAPGFREGDRVRVVQGRLVRDT